LEEIYEATLYSFVQLERRGDLLTNLIWIKINICGMYFNYHVSEELLIRGGMPLFWRFCSRDQDLPSFSLFKH
jgi:hypothetical protein